MKATGTGRAPHWCPDWFWTKKLLLNWNLPYIMLKMRFPFLYTSTSLKTKTSTIDSNHNFESCQLSCSSAHFPVFPLMPQVFLLPLALLLIIVSSSSMLHRVIKIKNVSAIAYFSQEILIHCQWCQEVLCSHWFAVSGGEIISLCSRSCLQTFLS